MILDASLNDDVIGPVDEADDATNAAGVADDVIGSGVGLDDAIAADGPTDDVVDGWGLLVVL